MQLSLQSLYKMILNKADKNHTHSHTGEIESAKKLNGVSFDHFIRNDLKDQSIESNTNSTSLTLHSNNTLLQLNAGNNKTYLVIDNENLNTNNLHIIGYNKEKVNVNIDGELNVNGEKIATLSDINSINVQSQLPTGFIAQSICSNIPDGYIEANGQLLLKDDYPDLYNFAKNNTSWISDNEWLDKLAINSTVPFYSWGDGVNTFRLPKLESQYGEKIFIKK